jgi:hypothetical protein
MAPAFRRSGRRYCAPSFTSHQIFSHVTITSPNAASTMGLPESRADTLHHCAGYVSERGAPRSSTRRIWPAKLSNPTRTNEYSQHGAVPNLQMVSWFSTMYLTSVFSSRLRCLNGDLRHSCMMMVDTCVLGDSASRPQGFAALMLLYC